MTQTTPLSHRRPTDLNTFYYGSPYYPEHWEEPVRAADAQRMKEAGWNLVRMAEFAWDLLEPREGTYDFSLFDHAIEDLGRHGIATMLCTPTATPPRWLTAKHTEVLRVDADGVAMTHGSRQHACPSGRLFRDFSRSITRAMAEHYAANPHVAGWQTDNELNCHFAECHCDNCRRAFREFLKRKYDGDVAMLNYSWGTSFWAQTYVSFEEIDTPRAGRPTYLNPAHQLDYFRFLSWTTTRFQRDQVEILRAVQPRWFVTHNGFFRHIDYRGDFGRDLDFLGYDCYPHFEYDPARRRFWQANSCDHARGWAGNYMVPEQQSGPGGQAGYFHDTPEPGEMRRMAYVSIARGADSLLFFRWRTCRFGAEEYWCGILDHDNVPRRRYDEAKQLGAELARVGPEVLGTTVRVDVGIAGCDLDVYDAHETLPFGIPGPREAAGVLHAFYYDRGHAVGYIHPTDDLRDVKLYFIPHWALFDQAWIGPLTAYVTGGGVLVVGARTATRDVNNNVIGDPLPGALSELCGVTVEEYGKQNAPEARPLSIVFGNGAVPTTHWYETLAPATGTEVLNVWAGRHLSGEAAVTLRRRGKGAVVYVGTQFTPAIVEGLALDLNRLSGVAPLWPDAPHGVETVCRQDADRRLWFFINHRDQAVTLAAAPRGTELTTSASVEGALHLEPNGVAVIKETRA